MRASSRFLIRSSLCVLALALAGCTVLTPASPTLPTGFAQALQDAGVPVSAVGLQVQAVDRIAPLRSHNASLPMKPASIMKLVTTSAALDLLGPAYRWTTRVYADGVQTGEVLQGDLIIQGGGDPRLAHEDLWRLLRRLRAQGLREIRGDLILDRSLFAITEQDAAQFDAQPLRPYNALPDALLLDGKALTLRFLPDAASQRVQVSSEPLLAGLELIAPALSHTDCQDWRSGLGTTFEPGVLRFAGSYPLSCGEQRYPIHAVGLTHAGYFDAVLRQIWQELGGSITGVTREGRVPASAKEIQQWQSMPLADVIGDINKFSNNVMARQLLLSLAAAPGGEPATLEAARERVRSWLAGKGIIDPALVLENGAGLSRTERISAASMARLLQLAWQSPTMPEFIASLPVAGMDGTMQRRVQSHSVRAHAHIKTGSIAEVASMAGYVTARSGRRVMVVCMINHTNANTSALREAMDALLEWVYENG